MDKPNAKKGYTAAIAMTALAVAVWGFAFRLYSNLLPEFWAVFELSQSKAAIARPVVVAGYILMALPAAFVSRNLGYKIGMLFGLGLFAVGMFLVFPALHQHSLGFYLFSATVVGAGLAILEVTAIPLFVFLGRKRRAVQRTVMASALSPLGGFLALYLGPHFLHSSANAAPSVSDLVALFSTVGAVSIGLAFLMELTHYPAIARARVAPDDRTLASFGPPLRQKSFRLALAACLVMPLSQSIVSGFAWPLSRAVMPSLSGMGAHQVVMWVYLAVSAGRLLIPLAMNWIAPMRLVVVCAIASAILAAITALSSGPVAVAGIILTAFCGAILFPAVFANALMDMDKMAKSGAAMLMLVSFCGNGFISVTMLLLQPLTLTPQILGMVMILPVIGYAGATALALAIRRAKVSPSSPSAAIANKNC